MGGHGLCARGVTDCACWLSLGLPGDALADALRRLAAEEGAAGRDPADNDDVTLSGVTTSTTVDQATLEQVSALGARRAVIHLGAADLTEARAKLRQAADRAHLKG